MVPGFIRELAAGIELLSSKLDEIDADWSPDGVPPNCGMGDLGWLFAESIGQLSLPEVETVFSRLEAILQHGTQDEQNAAATGFLEALVSVLDSSPDKRWILKFAGAESLAYIASWNEFCGL